MTSLRLQIRNLRRLVFLLLVVCAASTSLAAFAIFRSSVSLHELRLDTPDGKTRAKLEFENGYPQLVFFDRDGVRRAQFDEAGLLLFGDDGTTMLREIGDASVLRFKRNYDGIETQTLLSNDGQEQYLRLLRTDRPDQVRVSVDAKEGARVVVQDPDDGTATLPGGE